jgi:hypothetical protein
MPPTDGLRDKVLRVDGNLGGYKAFPSGVRFLEGWKPALRLFGLSAAHQNAQFCS